MASQRTLDILPALTEWLPRQLEDANESVAKHHRPTLPAAGCKAPLDTAPNGDTIHLRRRACPRPAPWYPRTVAPSPQVWVELRPAPDGIRVLAHLGSLIRDVGRQ